MRTIMLINNESTIMQGAVTLMNGRKEILLMRDTIKVDRHVNVCMAARIMYQISSVSGIHASPTQQGGSK